jgi:hypothetical protein
MEMSFNERVGKASANDDKPFSSDKKQSSNTLNDLLLKIYLVFLSNGSRSYKMFVTTLQQFVCAFKSGFYFHPQFLILK